MTEDSLHETDGQSNGTYISSLSLGSQRRNKHTTEQSHAAICCVWTEQQLIAVTNSHGGKQWEHQEHIIASMSHPSVTEEVSEFGCWHIRLLFVCPSGFARVRGRSYCGAQAVWCWLDPVSGTLEGLHRGLQTIYVMMTVLLYFPVCVMHAVYAIIFPWKRHPRTYVRWYLYL